jgi:phosphoglycolate phosphatase-like HAD superfamily hydrolase
MTKLALFDIDGTLLESTGFDSDCYVAAIRDVLGIGQIDTDWSHYVHSTDSGILAELYRNRFKQEIPPEIEEQTKERFVDIQLDRFRSEHVQLRPLAGAGEALHLLDKSGEWKIALATGSWKESAEVKIMNAMLPVEKFPLFSCADSVSREGIMQAAIQAMQSKAGAFEKMVYLGDGLWDVKASRKLGVAFLGMGTRAAELLKAGASHALRDYSDLKFFLRALEACAVPRV